MTDHEIALNWLVNCRDAITFGAASDIADKTFWAYQKLYDLCRTEPFRALEIVREILEMNPEERVISNLAAGPLEDILVRNGVEVMSHIKKSIAENEKFATLLEGVWTDRMNPAVRKEIDEILELRWGREN